MSIVTWIFLPLKIVCNFISLSKFDVISNHFYRKIIFFTSVHNCAMCDELQRTTGKCSNFVHFNFLIVKKLLTENRMQLLFRTDVGRFCWSRRTSQVCTICENKKWKQSTIICKMIWICCQKFLRKYGWKGWRGTNIKLNGRMSEMKEF